MGLGYESDAHLSSERGIGMKIARDGRKGNLREEPIAKRVELRTYLCLTVQRT